MDTMIDLRTPHLDRLVGRLEPSTMRLHVRHRGECCVFELGELARGEGLIRVSSVDRETEKGNCQL